MAKCPRNCRATPQVQASCYNRAVKFNRAHLAAYSDGDPQSECQIWHPTSLFAKFILDGSAETGRKILDGYCITYRALRRLDLIYVGMEQYLNRLLYLAKPVDCDAPGNKSGKSYLAASMIEVETKSRSGHVKEKKGKRGAVLPGFISLVISSFWQPRLATRVDKAKNNKAQEINRKSGKTRAGVNWLTMPQVPRFHRIFTSPKKSLHDAPQEAGAPVSTRFVALNPDVGRPQRVGAVVGGRGHCKILRHSNFSVKWRRPTRARQAGHRQIVFWHVSERCPLVISNQVQLRRGSRLTGHLHPIHYFQLSSTTTKDHIFEDLDRRGLGSAADDGRMHLARTMPAHIQDIWAGHGESAAPCRPVPPTAAPAAPQTVLGAALSVTLPPNEVTAVRLPPAGVYVVFMTSKFIYKAPTI
ncbi:hypothetical protein DFH06DRAFT_1293750 [Mycena polygramma]|nr:hypothetical protein DFH06DRAFT_1293750 [Mycena polygramma]